MSDNIIKIWMPVQKSSSGQLMGILSDDSLDRDNEFMTKGLLESWARNTTLKALANHENKMQSWIGGWTNLKVVSKRGKNALMAEPWFFSEEANPLAAQIKMQVNEALERGEKPGISIGAIPTKTIEKEVDGEVRTGYSEGELLEATWVPVQSNRNATFGHIAKKFDLNLIKNSLEDNKMEKDVEKNVEKTYSKKEFDEQVSKLNKEVEEANAKVSEAESKVEEAEASKVEAESKVSEAEVRAEEAEKQLKELKSKAVNLPKKETELDVKGVKELTVEKMLGGQ